MATLSDVTVRRRAFAYVRKCVRENLRRTGREVVTGTQLKDGFTVGGEHIHLLSAGGAGIHSPRQIEMALTIMTRAPVNGREPPYGDTLDSDSSLLHYAYEGKNPSHWRNEALRKTHLNGAPVIYLRGVTRGSKGTSSTYLPSVARLVDDRPSELEFVAFLEDLTDNWRHLRVDLSDLDALVTSANVQRRLHQAEFRLRVLRAYRGRCTLCQLNQEPLLDAAHIKPHSDRGLAIVPNGLAMCTLHHRAFDRDIIGIAPDRQVSVRRDVMDDEDGPMLRHGLQDFHERKIWIPRSDYLKPDQNFLEERYEQFKAAPQRKA